MKKMIAVILCLVLSAALLLCGCTQQTTRDRDDDDRTSFGTKLEDVDFGNNGDEDDDTQFGNQDAVKNEFFNDSNSFYDVDNLSIRPRHVYWEGDKLVAECFVTNGKSTMAYNVNVKRLSFSNSDGVIVDAAFGPIDGLTVPAYGYTVWTFHFNSDAVVNPGADLSSLHYESSVSYSH